MNQRLVLRPTNEEKAVFGNLFMMADKEGKNRLEAAEAAEFLRKSGLPKDMLRKIWLIAAKTDQSFLEKDELYISMRLVALAQNNMEVSEEAIRINHPLPPTPKFNFRNASSEGPSTTEPSNNSNPQSAADEWTITQEDEEKYKKLFNNTRDTDDKISLLKLSEMFQKTNMNNENINRILTLVPQMPSGGYNYRSFRVIFHLIYKSLKDVEIPLTLPRYLKDQLEDQESRVLMQQNVNMNIKDGPIRYQEQITLSDVSSKKFEQSMPKFNTINFENLDVGDSEVAAIMEDIVKTCKKNEMIYTKNYELREKIMDLRKRIGLEKDKLDRANKILTSKLDELNENQELLSKANDEYLNFKLSLGTGNSGNINANSNANADANSTNNYNLYGNHHKLDNRDEADLNFQQQLEEVRESNRQSIVRLNSNLIPK